MSDEYEEAWWEQEALKESEASEREAHSELAEPVGSALPSVAGRMEMTHADFQRACQVELERLQDDPNFDTRLVYLLCEAVRCSREACELTTMNLPLPNTGLGPVRQ